MADAPPAVPTSLSEARLIHVNQFIFLSFSWVREIICVCVGAHRIVMILSLLQQKGPLENQYSMEPSLLRVSHLWSRGLSHLLQASHESMSKTFRMSQKQLDKELGAVMNSVLELGKAKASIPKVL
jgi:hypothetical protein